MGGESVKIDTINELKIWLEGRFDLLAAAQKASSEDLVRVRAVVHDLSNHVQVLLALNIPDKLEDYSQSIKSHDAQIKKLVEDGVARKAALKAIYLVCTVMGAVLGTLGTLVIQYWSTMHH